MYPTCKSRNFNKQLEILGIDEKMMLKWALKITSEVVYFVCVRIIAQWWGRALVYWAVSLSSVKLMETRD
jgi:hypothetical protein